MNNSSNHPEGHISLGSYTLDPSTGIILSEDGYEIFMEHRLRDLLLVLYDKRGRFVSKKEIMTDVWKGTVVSDQSVAKAVSDLRRFFQTNTMESMSITTVRKLGYRLEVSPLQEVALIEQPTSTLRRALPYTIAALFLLIFFILHH